MNIKRFLCIIGLSLGLSGCQPSSETAVSTATEQQILLKGNAAEPADLDPHVVTGLSEYNILLALFEGLVTPHPETLEPLPGVAKSWDISPDGKTYTFHLRENARWSNGDPVTAQDFAFAYERVLSPKLGAENANMLYPIKNAQAFNDGELTDFSKVGVHAINNTTLEIQLEQPTPYFLGLIMHWAWYPVQAQTLKAHNAETQRGTGWTQPGSMVTNGPFQLKSWSIGDTVVVEQNPHYWNQGQVSLIEIHFFPITETNTEERATFNIRS